MSDYEQEEYQEVLGQISEILSEFWKTSDTLYRMDRVIAAQKRVDSLLTSDKGREGFVKHITGVFNRANHPDGYGLYNGTDDNGNLHLRAHGYVTLYVNCDDEPELIEVTKNLMYEDFYGLPAPQYGGGFLGEWFGGRFDLVSTFSGHKVNLHSSNMIGSNGFLPSDGRRFATYGDNRFVGIYTAREVLDN